VVSFEQFKHSPRMQRRAFFASLAVLIGGIVALIVTVILPSKTNAQDTPISNQPAQMVQNDPPARVDPAAVAVGRKFLLTAVVRKNLDWAYNNVHVDLKGRMSRKVWDRGNIPVIPFDAQNATTTAFIPQFSLQKEVEFEIVLIPKVHAKFAGTTPLRFYIALRRDHDKAHGRWLVSYFEPHWKPPLPLAAS
jgi:hypothetical protein